MNKLGMVAAGVLVVGVAVAVLGAVHRKEQARAASASSAESEHGNGMDHAMSAAIAMYKAPEGATPCESAYNAFKASLDYSTEHSVTPIVLKLAPRDEFLQRCAALPSITQTCLVPVYLARHRVECSGAKPAPDVLAAMVQLKAVSEPARGSGGGPWEEPSAGSH